MRIRLFSQKNRFFCKRGKDGHVAGMTKATPLVLATRRYERRRASLILVGRLVLLMSLMALWQWASGRVISSLFISSPLVVLRQLSAWIADGTLWSHTAMTVQETLLGLLFGTISGIVFGFFLGPQYIVGRIFDPFLVAFYSIPKVALAPLFIVWFGIGVEMKVILAAMTVFFLMFFHTLAGVCNVDQDLVNAVRLMGGSSRDVLFKVMIPAASGSILVGLHMAIPSALIGAVIAELVASNRGLGYLINYSASQFNTAGVLAALVTLTIIAALLNAIVDRIDQKTSRWRTDVRMSGRLDK
jgi:NitT/TauT family transport system permease protein